MYCILYFVCVVMCCYVLLCVANVKQGYDGGTL